MGGVGGGLGLGASAFLADLTPRDRDPVRIAATVVAGVCVGLVAAFACYLIVLVPYTFTWASDMTGCWVWGKAAIAVSTPGREDLIGRMVVTLVSILPNLAFWVAIVSMAAVIADRHVLPYATCASRIRWRLVIVGLVFTALVMAPLVAADRLSAPNAAPMAGLKAGWGGWSFDLLSALLLIPAAAAEELMFRGWLLRQLAAFTRRPGVLILATALVFAAAHFDFAPDAFLARALMGAGFAYMTLRLGGIELATGAHAANNILIVLFIEPLTLKATAGAGAVTGDAGLADFILFAGYVFTAEAVARIGPLRRWAGVEAKQVAPPLGSAWFG